MADKLTCPSCGAKYKSGRKRCKVCGYLLSGDELDLEQDIGDGNDEGEDEIDKMYVDVSDAEEFYKLKDDMYAEELASNKPSKVVFVVKVIISVVTAFLCFNMCKVLLLQIFRIILRFV